MATKIAKGSYWDKRENLTNKPSLSFRTIEVVQHIMHKEEVAVGVAIDMLMKTEGLYEEIVFELSESYPDIKQ